MDSVILGVVSGVVTAAILQLFGKLFTHHVIPWYRAITYRGVDISGTWMTTHENGDHKARFELTLVQREHALTGSATIIQGVDLKAPTSVVNMEVDGSVWEGFVTLNLKE